VIPPAVVVCAEVRHHRQALLQEAAHAPLAAQTPHSDRLGVRAMLARHLRGLADALDPHPKPVTVARPQFHP
jgi:hypothetical protein